MISIANKLYESINSPDIHAQKVLARKYKEKQLLVAIYDKLLTKVTDVLSHPCLQQHTQHLATVQHQLEQKAPTTKIVKKSRKYFIPSLYLKIFYSILHDPFLVG